jgi:protease-4
MRLVGRVLIGFVVLVAIAGVCEIGAPAGPSIEPESTLVLRVSGVYVEGGEPALLPRLLGEDRATFAGLLTQLALAERDDRIQTVVLRIEGLGIGWGKAQELRGAIRRLRAAGRHTVGYLDLGSLIAHREYFVAAAADEVVLVPGGSAPLVGLSATYTYLGGLFEKVGIGFEIGKAGRYKSAVEAFAGTEMSEASREMANSLLESTERQFLEGIASDRGLSLLEVRERIDKGPLSGDALISLGFVDRQVPFDALLEDLGGEIVYGKDYATVDPSSVGFDPQVTHALVYGSGNVVDGKGEQDPTGAQVFAAGAFARALEAAAKDDEIAAIILRIDSPGGSALASERMWRKVQEVRNESGKPVIASFSDVAASGGYYVAAAADEIVAPGMSLTGSIGVFALIPNFAGLQRELGVSSEFLARGRFADFGSTSRPWSSGARKKLEEMVLDIYFLFLDRVASGRALEVAAVDAVAQGRVWTGVQAYERRLVDELGGLHEAVVRANLAVGVDGDADAQLRSFPPPRTLAEQVADLVDARVARAVNRRLEALEAVGAWARVALDLPERTPLLVPPATVQIQ